MKLVKSIKRDTTIVMVSVILLTILTLNVSYSAFFDIKTKSSVQQISTGTFNVTASATPLAGTTEFFPASGTMPNAATATLPSTLSGNKSTLIVTNSGDIDASFTVTISKKTDGLPTGRTTADLIDMAQLYVAVRDVSANQWVNIAPSGAAAYNKQISTLTAVSANTEYNLFSGTINKKGTSDTTKTYEVYVWLASNADTSQIGKLVYLNLNVKSKPTLGQK